MNFKHISLVVFLLGGVIFALSCKNDDGYVYFVDDKLKPYFDAFEQEAASRGVTVDLLEERIGGRIGEISQRNVVGQCFYNEESPNEIFIDEDYWRLASDVEKEFVVFHELGHCYLLRQHTEDKDDSGFCTSIMNSGKGVCQNNYHEGNRDVLLDELFQPQ